MSRLNGRSHMVWMIAQTSKTSMTLKKIVLLTKMVIYIISTGLPIFLTLKMKFPSWESLNLNF